MKFAALMIAILVGSFAHALSLNDLSILVPLPTKQTLPQMLSFQTQGPRGVLLPMTLTTRFPRMIPEYTQEQTFSDLFKVIGIRIDPCFAEGLGPQACRRQIRLVWQPVLEIDGVMSTRDAAIHSFYDFTEAEWEVVIQDWKNLITGAPADELQVHPEIKAQGLHGPLWQSMRKFILKHCGQTNWTRVTGMNVMNGEQVWSFLGYDVVKGELVRIEIPRIKHDIQGVILSLSNPVEFNGRMVPPISEETTMAALIQDSWSLKNGQNEKEIKELMGRVVAMENPRLHNPGTMDCVSCHMAQSLRQWAEKNFVQWNWKMDFKTETYESSWPLINRSEQPFASNQLRAFGYFGNRSVISQRVINETTVVRAGF